MTHDETRDELARMDGYTISSDGIISRPEWGEDYVACVRAGLLPRHDHPHPPTLDGANAAVPEGWTWERIDGYWYGWPPYRGQKIHAEEVPDTGNPMDDLYALALACRRAMEEHNGK